MASGSSKGRRSVRKLSKTAKKDNMNAGKKPQKQNLAKKKKRTLPGTQSRAY